jgi:transposase
MSRTYHLGLDVHKEKVAIAHAAAGEREDPVYYGKCAASVQNTERTLRKIAKKLEVEFRDLKICYEAGPTGFVLARRLIHLGVECVVVAPHQDRAQARREDQNRSARRPETRVRRVSPARSNNSPGAPRTGSTAATSNSRRGANRRTR